MFIRTSKYNDVVNAFAKEKIAHNNTNRLLMVKNEHAIALSVRTMEAENQVANTTALINSILSNCPPITTVRDSIEKLNKKQTNQLTAAILEKVELDHIMFKLHIYQMVHLKDFSEPNVTDHTTCNLGLWYYNEQTQEEYTNNVIFKELEQSHVKIHEAGQDVILKAAEGDVEGSIEAMAEMETHSVVLLLNINKLKK